jgi:hypothetical protein
MGGLVLAVAADVGAAAKQVVTAVSAKQAPAGLDDPLWRSAPAVEVPAAGAGKFEGKKLAVQVKAAYTPDSVHLLFTWPDATQSVTKGTWEFDGKAWGKLKGDEDRLALLFEITRIEQFATKGCAVACHVPPGKPASEGKFGTKTDAEKGDLWHWKAARSAPYGVADDTWITAVAPDKTGRKNDKGAGGDVTNETKDKTRPLYMQDPGKTAPVPGFLLKEDAIEIKDHAAFKAGDRITHRLPVRPEGSRGDIKAVSRYGSGGWTLLLSRKLNTGHDDDVAFDPRREYNFGMAVFDDSGDEDSYDSEALTLRFGR